MNSEFYFIRTRDYEDYRDLNGGVGRLLVESPVRAGDVKTTGQAPRTSDLVESITSELRLLTQAHEGKYSTSLDTRWFSCHCIEVNADDGMSWSAEQVSRALRNDFPQFHHWELKRKADTEWPWRIADFIGHYKFIRLAGKHKLGSALLTGRSWVTWAIIGLFAAISISIALFDYLSKATSSRRAYYFLIASAVLGVATKYLTPLIGMKTFSEKLASLGETLDKVLTPTDGHSALSNEHLPPNYEAFIESLAAELARDKFPRYVIVDNYSAQDHTTKNVIDRYFETYAKDANGGEFWIIFDGQRGPKFSSLIRSADDEKLGYSKSTIFRQLFISDREKRDLIEREQLPQSAFAFRAIKLIRHPDETASGVERVKQIIDDYQQAHPKNVYGDLELLYLLTLTAARPSGFALRVADLLSKLSKQNLLRNAVLSQLLPRTTRGKGDIGDRFKVLRSESQFQSLVEFDGKENKETIHINVETALAFEEYAANWNLPPPELVHLYWSLYYLDDRTGKPVEAFWMEKTSEHLIRANPAFLDAPQIADNKTKILEQLFTGNLETSTGCLKTCVFDHVPRLLRKAFDLIESTELANNQSRQERMIKKCWEAYSLLGNDQILEVLLDLYEYSGGKVATGDGDGLPALFFQSMALPPEKRAIFKPEFFKWLGWSGRALASITQYAHVRSAWLAFTVAPTTGRITQTSLHQATHYYDEVLPDLTRTALERIKTKSEDYVRITDVLTVSLALWCCALRVRLAVQGVTKSHPVVSLQTLLDLATSAVLRAAEIKEESHVASPESAGIDFLSSGLAKELYSVALSSVLLGCHYVRELGQQTIKDVNDILSFSGNLMDFELSPVSTQEEVFSDTLVRQVDQMLTFCEILWEGFGFSRLRDFMNLRRIHFNSMMLTAKYKTEITDEVVRESLGTALSESNFTGLIANLVVGDCLKQIGDLEAVYLRRAGGILLSESFDRELTHELCLMIISETHHLGQPLDEYVENVLAEDAGKESFLLQFLKQASVESTDAWLLVLHNVSHNIRRLELKPKLRDTLVAFVESIETPELRSRVDDFLAYHLLTEKLDAQEKLAPADVLADWQNRKSSPFYAAVLYLMLEKHPTSFELLSEGVSAVDHDPTTDQFTSSLLLAERVLGIILDSNQRETSNYTHHLNVNIPVRYLRTGVEYFQEGIPVDLHLRIHSLLYEADSQEYRSYHLSKKAEWTQNILLTRNLQLLTSALGAQGQYFLVFRDYYRTMRNWGLRARTAEQKAPDQNGQSDTDRFADWLQGDRQTPMPLIGNSVSADFLEIGNILFSDSQLQDETLQDARAEFDRVAREILPKLLILVLELDLPPTLKSLLRAYSDRFSPPAESAFV